MSRASRVNPGAPPVRLAAERVALFTDLHLQRGAPEEIAAFAAQLEALPPDTEACVILGDLFDAFIGKESWDGPFEQLASAIRALIDRPIRVFVVRGNRDVLLEERDLPGGPEIVDSILLENGESPLLLTHGDQFCLGDARYQLLRRRMRGPLLRPILRRLPLRIRLNLAGRLRSLSRGEVARKPLDTLALTESAVEEARACHGARGVVIGHLHVDELRFLPNGARLRILPAWNPQRGPIWTTSVLDGTN